MPWSHLHPFPAAQDPAHDDQPFPKINSSKCTDSELNTINTAWLTGMNKSLVHVCLIGKTTRWIQLCYKQLCQCLLLCRKRIWAEQSALNTGIRAAGEGTSQRSSSPSLQLRFPESISLLVMNWQELDPMNPSVISCGGPDALSSWTVSWALLSLPRPRTRESK